MSDSPVIFAKKSDIFWLMIMVTHISKPSKKKYKNLRYQWSV